MSSKLDEIKAEIVRNAGQFVEVTQNAFGFTLDYSETSIAQLDNIFEDIRGDLSEEGINSTAVIGGCYIGEVARRNGLAEWIDGTSENIPEIMRQPVLLKSNEGTITDPIAWVGKRLINGNEDNIAFKFGLLGSDTPMRIQENNTKKPKKKTGLLGKLFGK